MICRYDVMSNCWNENPEKRPPFSKLRSQFDTMLLADEKNHCIEDIASQNVYFTEVGISEREGKAIIMYSREIWQEIKFGSFVVFYNHSCI